MQAVIPHLVNNGHEVIGVDNLSRYGKRRNLAKTPYEFHKLDLIHPNVVWILMNEAKPDYVIQAAAMIYGVGGFTSHPADILGNDITVHGNILRAAKDMATVRRVVYISSSMVYENLDSAEEWMTETSRVHKTDYGLSKYVGERLSKAYWEQYQLPYTIWRPFNIITPYEKAEYDIGSSHVFADYLHQIIIMKNKKLPIIGNGFQIRCFTDIRDTSKAIADLSFSTETNNSVFNLGSTEAVTMRRLAQTIADMAYKKGLIDFRGVDLEFETVKDYPNDVKTRIPDTRCAESILHWRPKYTLNDSINFCLENL